MGAPYGNKNAAGKHKRSNVAFISSVKKARSSMYGIESAIKIMSKAKRPRSKKALSIVQNKMNYLNVWR
jgi:hypothetical protein